MRFALLLVALPSPPPPLFLLLGSLQMTEGGIGAVGEGFQLEASQPADLPRCPMPTLHLQEEMPERFVAEVAAFLAEGEGGSNGGQCGGDGADSS